MLLRYIIAVIVACVLTAGGFGVAASLKQGILKGIRQGLREQKVAGTLPPELQNLDLDTWVPGDVGIQVSSSAMKRMAAAEFILNGWFVWVPLVIAICLGTTALFSRSAKTQGLQFSFYRSGRTQVLVNAGSMNASHSPPP